MLSIEEKTMRTLTSNEVDAVSGGASITPSAANQIIGRAFGEAWHALTSWEAIVGSSLGPGGTLLGIYAHYQLQH